MLGREDLGTHALGRVGARRGRWLLLFVHASGFRRSGEAGFEPATPARNDAPVGVDKQRGDHRSHHCADEQAQLGSCAHDLCDEAAKDSGENGVDHPDDRGRAGNQAEDPVLRAWAVGLG